MATHSAAFFKSLSEADTSPIQYNYTRRRMLHFRTQMARLRRRLSRRKSALILMVIMQMRLLSPKGVFGSFLGTFSISLNVSSSLQLPLAIADRLICEFEYDCICL